MEPNNSPKKSPPSQRLPREHLAEPAPAPASQRLLRERFAAASPPPVPPAAPAVPADAPRIGKYPILESFDSGTRGQVFKCFDGDRRRDVAIKVAHTAILAPEGQERFLHQVEIAAAVRHENVCPIDNVGWVGRRPFIVTPFFDGGTLAQWRRKNRLPPILEALERVLGLARGLAALHEAGIVHQALKPDNILVDGPRFLIADHGWSLADGDTIAGSTQTYNRYMAPEQWRADGPYRTGERSDIFSLGVILFELLTNSHPYPWLTDDVLAQGVAAWTQRPRAPSEVLYGLDRRLDVLCLGALALVPGERYASAEAFANEIDRCRQVVAAGLLITGEEDFKKGEEYFYGAPGIPRDPGRARKLFERAAAQGYAPAQNSLGCLYQHALGVPRDYDKARELYEKAAEQGDSRAQNNLGYMYLKGLGVERDYAKARELYRKAAKQGDAAGQYSLGCLYLHALGVPQDYTKARELYELAAEQGFAKAQNGLGFMYLEGLGVEKDHLKACELYELAAKQGFGVAQSSLGYMYLKGLGVEQNYDLARVYFEKAVRQGIAQADTGLGYMYQYGLGVEQHFDKARELFEKAAKKGLPEAFYSLGFMYQNGLGVKRNYVKARQLYEKAAAHGDEDATKALRILLSKM